MELLVNGKQVTVETDPERSLLFVLRDELDLTGAKYGCGEGQCGACTVLIGGVATRSCVTPVGKVGGRAITTIEAWRRTASCIRCRRLSSKPTPCNAATARRA